MFLLRKIGSIVRGSASLPQIVLACTLGSMLGFIPGFFLPGHLGGGFMQAPGLIVALFALVLLLDANLAIFGLVTVGAKLLSFLLVPLSFSIGRYLLEGPTEGLFRTLVNAPVTAWFGLERYATTGGVTLGFAIGIVTGFVVYFLLHRLRLKFAQLEEGSERYQKLSSKKSVKLASWVLLGGGKSKKKTWREIAESDKKSKGVRISGLIVVVVLLAALWFAQDKLGGKWLHEKVQTALTYWNGATVDLAGASLDLADGRLNFDGLAMADKKKLDHDSFRARAMEVDLSNASLLSGRFVVDKLVSGEAKSGVVREKPGVRVTPEPTPPEPPAGPGKTLDDYLKDAKVWKDRLDTAREWIGRLTGGGPAAKESKEERNKRIAEEKETLGLIGVVATHLRADHPAVTVRELAFDGMTIEGLGELVDVKGLNLSSSPALGDAPAKLSMKARSGAFGVELSFDPKQPDRAGISFHLDGLPVEKIAGALSNSPIQGGTVDLKLDGALALGGPGGVSLDVPLLATLHGTTLAVGGKSASIDKLEVPIGLRGPLQSPKISIDAKQLGDALVAAGRSELAKEVGARADALLGVPGAGAALSGLVEGTKTPEQLAAEAKAKLEEEAKKKAEEAKAKAEAEAKKKAEEEIKKRLPGGIEGLLPGKKKKDGG
ncbi:MAG: hypothetical protein U1F36_01675 [Planctomycetota bacterium]